LFYQITEMEPAPDGTRFTAPPDLIAAQEDPLFQVAFKLEQSDYSHDTIPYRHLLSGSDLEAIAKDCSARGRDSRSPFKLNIVMIDSADEVGHGRLSRTVPWPTKTVESVPFQKWTHDPTLLFARYARIPGVWHELELAHVTVVDLEQPGFAKVRAEVPPL